MLRRSVGWGYCERDYDGNFTFMLQHTLVRLVGRVVDSARDTATCPSAFFNAILSQENELLDGVRGGREVESLHAT